MPRTLSSTELTLFKLKDQINHLNKKGEDTTCFINEWLKENHSSEGLVRAALENRIISSYDITTALKTMVMDQKDKAKLKEIAVSNLKYNTYKSSILSGISGFVLGGGTTVIALTTSQGIPLLAALQCSTFILSGFGVAAVFGIVGLVTSHIHNQRQEEKIEQAMAA
jgi:hypothetical protein